MSVNPVIGHKASTFTVTRASSFVGERPWDARQIARFADTAVRLHWTDQPYQWHVNDGQEVFVVLDGLVAMHYRDAQGITQVVELKAGDIFYAGEGLEHVAHPCGEARILVIEKLGSI
ncbi:cupin [Parvibium lacunae]|uniref:Cupin n=1 Tax=Parvibium lacunae TaxID=1888893 RepID=A0A368L856_9BURK|nr:cupin [Parvibium lacunae]RCS59845.1 cupin [Parvibium lacunae]